MKLKSVKFDNDLSNEVKEMIQDYFKSKSKNGVEGFKFSEKDFLKKYDREFVSKHLSKPNFYAIYTIECCDMCLKEKDVIILHRLHLDKYLNSQYKFCKSCYLLNEKMGMVLGLRANTADITFEENLRAFDLI